MKIQIERLTIEVPPELLQKLHHDSLQDPAHSTRMHLLAAFIPKFIEIFERLAMPNQKPTSSDDIGFTPNSTSAPANDDGPTVDND